MADSFSSRLKHAWNAFFNKDPTDDFNSRTSYYGSYYRPDRRRLTPTNEKTIISSIWTRIAIDVSSTTIEQARLDQNGRFLEKVNSGLNNVLSLDANIDQTGRAFKQDIVMSMFDEGCVACVPTDTTENPMETKSYDILKMRTGKITQWFPNAVRVELYNESTGRREEVTLPKQMVAIIENPLYAVMNEPNSTMKRLARKLSLLDIIDEQTSSGKLDLIIQLPYVIKTESRKHYAEQRRKDIVDQLTGSKYGIAYTDGTERITQLNRPVENTLMSQIEYLTSMLYNQLGMTEEIFKGTADEQQMLNYNNRTIEPILAAITDEFNRKFLTKTARSQGQTIMFFRDPFKLVPVEKIASIADSFTRNEILSSNEVRSIIGYKPVDNVKADELRNKNLNEQLNTDTAVVDSPTSEEETPDIIDEVNSEIDKLNSVDRIDLSEYDDILNN